MLFLSCLVLILHRDRWWTFLEEEEELSRHLLRIFVACTSCAPPMPVHSIMLSIHAMAGLPRLLFPGTRPVITAFSILDDSCLIMCPKYPSFLAFTLCSNSGFSCNLSPTATLVSFAVHGTLRTLLAQLFSNALSFISSVFLKSPTLTSICSN